MYLGTIPVGSNQRNSVIFYFYSTATIPYSDGFRISGGPASTLSCDVSGMTLDYSGPPIEIPAPPVDTSKTRETGTARQSRSSSREILSAGSAQRCIDRWS